MMSEDGRDPQAPDHDTAASSVMGSGGGEGGHTINLVFSGAELGELAAYSGLHGHASDWLACAPEPIVLSNPAWMEAPGPETVSDHQVFVVYGDAPPSIEFTPANDAGGTAAPGVSNLLVPDAGEALLASLNDDGLIGAAPGEALETAAASAQPPQQEDGAETFVLTNLDINDLLSDIEQAADSGVSVGNADFFETAFAPVPPPEPACLGNVTIEIEDDLGLAATHIIA